jgi:hypothetical protein
MGGGTLRRVNAHRGGGVLEKLAVAQEPGLTNAQLMLTNHDLKPGEGRNLSLVISHTPRSSISISFRIGFGTDLSANSGTGASTMGSVEFRGVLDRGFF